MLPRSFRRILHAASLALLALAASGCEEQTPVKKGPATPAADPAEAEKIEQGKKLIRSANEAINDKNYDKARKQLEQARELGVESQRFEIDEAMEKVDKRQAKLWANEVSESFQNKDCAGAFKTLAEPFKALAESEAFTRELRRLIGAEALKCVQEAVDQKILGNAFADARKYANSDEVKSVLGPTAHGKLAAEMEATVLEALRALVEPDVKAKKWEKAVEKIDAAGKKGDASSEQVETLLNLVRDGVRPEIDGLATRTLGNRDAPAALKQIDALAKTARWAIPDGGATVAVGGILPEDLAKKRATLAVWVEAQRLAVKALKKGELRFTHGKVAVAPAGNADGPSKQEIPHGAKIWILGTAKNKALVTTTDPGAASLVSMLDQVAGWVPVDRLFKEDTGDWLVPDEQLKGERVWGPLRPGEPMWELGTVSEVNGKEIVVKRLADGVPFKLSRQKLRSGRLAPGTKVLTFCVAKDQPAQVVEVPPPFRSAKLKCDGGQEKEEDLASLRSKPELLPTSK
jgi:hypothetical protein